MERIVDKNEYQGLSEAEVIVTKILEFDILDPVWFQVLRNHPELQVNSDGKQIELPANHNLRYPTPISTLTNAENLISDMIGLKHVFCYVDVKGCLKVQHKTELFRSCSIDLRAQTALEPNGQLPTPGDLNIGSPFVIKSHAIPIKKFSQNIEDSIKHQLTPQVRIVVLNLDLYIQAVTADAIAAANAAAKKAKKDAPPVDLKPKKIFKFRLSVVDLYSTSEMDQMKLTKVHDFYLDNIPPIEFEEYNTENMINTNYLLYNYIKVELSPDCRIISLVINENPAVGQLFDLEDFKIHSSDNSTIPEEDLNSSLSPRAPGLASTQLNMPKLVSVWKVPSLDPGCNSKKVIINRAMVYLPSYQTPKYNLPFVKEVNESTPSDSIPTSNQENTRESYYKQLKVLLMLSEQPFIPVMQVVSKPIVEAVTGGKDSKAPAKGKKDANEPPPPPTYPCILVESLRLKFASLITHFKFFGEKYVVVGLMDGQISIWDLHLGGLIVALGKHNAIITSIDCIFDPVSSKLDLFAGSCDGTLAYYSNCYSNENDSNSQLNRNVSLASYFQQKENSFMLEKTKLIDFRQDVPNVSILSMNFLTKSSADTEPNLLAIHYQNSVIATYTLTSLQLISSLAIQDRKNYETTEWNFVSNYLLPKKCVYIPKDPPKIEEPVLDPKAAKGGKNVPPPEPIEPKEIEIIPEIPIEVLVQEEIRENASLINALKKRMFHKDIDGPVIADAFCQLYYQPVHCVLGNQYICAVYIPAKQSCAIVRYLMEDVYKGHPKDSIPIMAPAIPSRKNLTRKASARSVGTPSMSTKMQRVKGIPPSTQSIRDLSISRDSLSSSPSQELAALNLTGNPSLKTIKLTEERLSEHEKALTLPPNSASSARLTSTGRLNRIPTSATEDTNRLTVASTSRKTLLSNPNPIETFELNQLIVDEIIFQRNERVQQTKTFQKKITNLSSLCTNILQNKAQVTISSVAQEKV